MTSHYLIGWQLTNSLFFNQSTCSLAMQCNAMQCNAMQCNAMQCNAMQSASSDVCSCAIHIITLFTSHHFSPFFPYHFSMLVSCLILLMHFHCSILCAVRTAVPASRELFIS